MSIPSADAAAPSRREAPARPQRRVLFVAGFGRSGSTVLDRILGQVPDFFSLGELRWVWLRGLVENELCTCGRPFRECDFWRRVFDRAFGGMDRVDGQAMHDWGQMVHRTRYMPLLWLGRGTPAFQRRLEKFLDHLGRLMDALWAETGGATLIDSSKFPGYGMMLTKLPDVHVDVLHLVRDSRGVAYSWQKKKRRPEVRGAEQYIRQYGPVQSSGLWTCYNLGAELLRSRVASYQVLRYEDFTEAPRQTLQRLIESWGGDPRLAMFTDDRTVKLGGSHNVSGNPMRFNSACMQIRQDDQWKQSLPKLDRWCVSVLTAPLLARYRRQGQPSARAGGQKAHEEMPTPFRD